MTLTNWLVGLALAGTFTLPTLIHIWRRPTKEVN